MSTHQATTSTGSVVVEPSWVVLADLVSEVDRAGDGGFVNVERHDAPVEASLQAERAAQGWVLQLHAGGANRRFRSAVDDTAIVYSAVASWVFGGRAWQGLTWEHLGEASPYAKAG